MDPLDALDQSAATWTAALGLLPSDLEAASHLPGWSLRALVNHVHGGGERYLMYLRGATSADAEPTRHADYCQSNPIGVFAETQARLRAEFTDRTQWSEVVLHPAGPLTVLDSLHRRCLELVLHSWDIAKSVDLTGVDLCPMRKELAAYLSEVYVATNGSLDNTGYFHAAPPGHLSDPRAELLRLSGRS